MRHTPTPRLKDVLFALSAAANFERPLGRLPLQKMVYLSDVLAPIWREAAKPSAFIPYHNGPYDPQIQNTVDALVFRGFVQVSTPHFRQVRNVECQYFISKTGKQAIQNLIADPGLRVDLELFNEIAREVENRGWENIKELVYSEPTYDAARISADSARLRTDSSSHNLSREFLRDLREAFRDPDGQAISPRNLVQLFFAVLDEHISSKRTTALARDW